MMSDKLKLNDQTYHIVEKLGEGTYGKVYKVVSEETLLLFDQMTSDEKWSQLSEEPEYLVIKQIEADSQALISYVKNEIQTMKWLTQNLGDKSPFCKLIDYQIEIVSDQKGNNQIVFYILMEYLEGTDLLKYIKTKLKPTEILTIFRQLVLAVNILHSHQIIHRDLKLENILVNHDVDGQLRIIILDFGFACNRNPNYLFEQIENRDVISVAHNCHKKIDIGTVSYMPPEFYLKERRTFQELQKADVWACGVILYILIYKRLPFVSFKQFSYLQQIQDVKFWINLNPTVFSPILNQTLTLLPLRPTIQQLISDNLSVLGTNDTSSRPRTSAIPIPMRKWRQSEATDHSDTPTMDHVDTTIKDHFDTTDHVILPAIRK